MALISKRCKNCGHEYLAGEAINEDEWVAFPGYDDLCSYCQKNRKPVRKLTIPGVNEGFKVWGKKTLKWAKKEE